MIQLTINGSTQQLDIDPDTVSRHTAAGRNVIHADATDDEFWERTGKSKVSVVLLALARHEQNLGVTRSVRSRRNDVHIFAVVKYPEDAVALMAAGVDGTWNLYAEAGNGFADEVIAYLGDTLGKAATPVSTSSTPPSPAGT